jgi:alpha-tubulin suppressor-like RCC1 family protein
VNRLAKLAAIVGIALFGAILAAGCGQGTKKPLGDGGSDARDSEAETTADGPALDADGAVLDADGPANGADVGGPSDGGPADGSTTLKFKAIAVSTSGSCALALDGTAYCWGAGGALGVSAAISSSAVPLSVETTEKFDAIGLGDGLGCALNHAGNAFCWGFNTTGNVGDGTKDPRKTPVAVIGGHTFTSLAVGHYTACATTSDGAAYCWGSNAHGALGDGTGTDQSQPSKVSTALSFSQVSTSGDHTCALTKDGAAYCWGGNTLGTLGDGTKGDSPTPVPVVGGLSFKAIVAAETSKTCALTLDGAAYCWGIQANGALGNNVIDNVLAHAIDMPVAVSGTNHYTVLAGDVFSSCAVTTSGSAECWGFDGDGNLGDGKNVDRPVPGPLATDLPLASIAMSHWTNGHACALTTAGDVLCWGNNFGGPLGDGTEMARLTPIPIHAPASP